MRVSTALGRRSMVRMGSPVRFRRGLHPKPAAQAGSNTWPVAVESGSASPGLGHRGLLGHEPYRLDEGNCRSMRASPVQARSLPRREGKTACGAGEILLDRRTAVRGALPLCEEVVRPQRTAKGKGKEVTRSLPLSMYSAPGGLRQDPGRVAQSPAEARTCGNQGVAKCVCSCRRMGLAERRTAGGTRGAVAGTRRGGAGVRAAGLRGAAGRDATLLNRGFHD
jgi:hypothetical protein